LDIGVHVVSLLRILRVLTHSDSKLLTLVLFIRVAGVLTDQFHNAT